MGEGVLTKVEGPFAGSRSDVKDASRICYGGKVETAGVDLYTQLMLDNCTLIS